MFVDIMGLVPGDGQDSFLTASEFYKEYNISEITSTDPVTIIESSEKIVIYAYLNIVGEAKDLVIEGKNNTQDLTYREAIIKGIQEYWSGQYKNQKVEMILIDINDGKKHVLKDGQNAVEIRMNKGSGVTGMPGGSWKGYESPGSLDIYQNRDSIDDIEWNAAHEFGHVLGIGDAYVEPYVQRNPGKYVSIMNAYLTKVQYADIIMMLKAHNENKWQTWPRNWPSDWPYESIN